MNFIWKIYYRIPVKIRAKAAGILEKSMLWQKTAARRAYYLRVKRFEQITIELTDRCNLKCSYCPKSLNIGGKGGDMEWDTFTSLIDNSDYKNYYLTGYGEPFLYSKLIDAVRYVREKRPNSKIGFNTNASLINYDLGARLSEAGLSYIVISINATSAEQYRRLNNSGNYENIVKNTIEFLRAINDSRETTLAYIQVFREPINNAAQLKRFKEFWRPYLGKRGIISEITMFDMYGTIDINSIAREEMIARGEKTAFINGEGGNAPKRQKNSKRYPCQRLFSMHTVTKEGNALLCCTVTSSDAANASIGNIRDASVNELYMGDRAKELLRQNLNLEIYKRAPCDKCLGWQFHPNVFWRNPFYPLFGAKWF